MSSEKRIENADCYPHTCFCSDPNAPYCRVHPDPTPDQPEQGRSTWKRCDECGAEWIGGYRVHEEGCDEGMREAEQSPLPTPDQPEQGLYPHTIDSADGLCSPIDELEQDETASPFHQRLEGLIAEFENYAAEARNEARDSVNRGDFFTRASADGRAVTADRVASRLRAVLKGEGA